MEKTGLLNSRHLATARMQEDKSMNILSVPVNAGLRWKRHSCFILKNVMGISGQSGMTGKQGKMGK